MTQKKDYRAAQRRQATSSAGRSQRSKDTKPHSSTCSSLFTSPPTRSTTTATADMFFPQPMEIAFSLEAGSFSSDLFESSATASTAASIAPLPNAYVLCFEDVLIPIKWMAKHIGLRPSSKAIADARERVLRNPYLHESLARIEQDAIQLLTTVSARGPVCILGEQSAHFVEAVCQAFFPRLAYCLGSPQVFANVQVLGSPQKFETTQEKTAWRIHLLQALVRERLYAGSPHLLVNPYAGRFGLIVASPHQVDTLACGKAMEVAPYLVPKSLRVVNGRTVASIEQFVGHLQTLSHWLLEAAPCTTAFSVTV